MNSSFNHNLNLRTTAQHLQGSSQYIPVYHSSFSCTPPDPLVPYCYNANSSIAAYSMGVVTNITIATRGGLTGQIAPDNQNPEQQGGQELQEVGGLVVESILVLEGITPLKVK